MRKVTFSYHMELQFTQAIWNHVFSLRAFPMNLPEQVIGGMEYTIHPDCALQFHQDYFGNKVGAGRYDQAHSAFRFEMHGTAWIDQKKRKAEPCLPLYRYPSAACSMTKSMEQFLHDLHLSNGTVQAEADTIMQELHQYFQYQTGATLANTTAGEAFALGCGVCQDYAHILIALCRARGIAARYVAGIISGEGATHAWVEVYDRGMWYGLDPTQNRLIDDGYLKLAQGRDALDCQLNRGVFCGAAEQRQNIYVTLEELL